MGFKKNEPTESGTSVADVIEIVRRQMYKDLNDIEGDDSVEEEEDSNEVEEEKDYQSDNNENDDTNSGNDEEDNSQAEASQNKTMESAPKPSYNDQIPNDWFSLVLCLLCYMVHLWTQVIDWRALKPVMDQQILIEEGLQKDNVKLVRKRMINCMTIQTQEDTQRNKCSQVRHYDYSGWLMNRLQMSQISWPLYHMRRCLGDR